MSGQVNVFRGATLVSAADYMESKGLSGNDENCMNVSSGGTVNKITVNSGGSMYICGGGTAENTILNSGGALYISSGGKITGQLTAAAGATVSAYSGSILDFDISGRAASAPVLVNNLSLIQGTPDFTITVANDQAYGTYKLAAGPASFTGSIEVCTDNTCLGSITVGSTVELAGQSYTLNLTDDLLSFTVGAVIPVVTGVADDLNADGRADIVMTIDQPGHPADGSTGAWLIQQNQTAAWGDLSTRNAGWEIFGMGTTSAGKTTNDVYVRSADNVIGAWVTNESGAVSGWETVGEFDSSTQVLGLGDFNGNGQTDLLLRNTNGAVGCFFTGGDVTGWNYFQSLGDEWKLSAVGDLNGDGRADVVLKHDAGFAGSWLTQADYTMAWADLDTLPDGFAIIGAGDFNGDGTDDVLLKNGNYYGAWLVQDGNAAGWFGIGDLGDVTVEQIADFDGDGKDDLRIRTAAGDLGTQLVKGADTLDWKYYGSVGTEWSTSLAAI